MAPYLNPFIPWRKDGRVRHVFGKVKPEGHDQEVLAWVTENEDQ